MADSIEWDPSASEPAGAYDDDRPVTDFSSDDVLSIGRSPRRAPLVLQRLGDRARAVPTGVRLSMVALLIVGLAAEQLSPTDAPRRPKALAPSHPPKVAQQNPSFAGSSPVIAKALQAGRLTDFTRSTAIPGACAPVRIGHSPAHAVVLAVRHAMPTFRYRDRARTLDQSTGLCSLDVRAADARGTALIVEIVAPTGPTRRPFAAVNIGFTSDGTTSTSIASTLTINGWSITVAAVGPLSDQPAANTMLTLSQDASLIW